MRIGFNPNKNKEINTNNTSHRVIIAVYIPNFDGYFKGSFQVFKVCIESLLLTINEDTKISIISNASVKKVNDYIHELLVKKKIDRAIFNSENVGKMNAIIAETRASFEEFITYADSDVFFDMGWLKQTYEMFKNVSKAGFVSMNPTPRNLNFAYSTVLSNFTRFLFHKTPTNQVCSYSDLEHFHISIGRDKKFTDEMYNNSNIVGLKNNYIIGAGHFCCTIRKTPILKYIPNIKSSFSVSGGSENKYLDIPFDKTGLWRLSSSKAFVWHMGNNLEVQWAKMKLEKLNEFKEDRFSFNALSIKNKTLISSKIPYIFKVKFISILKKIKLIE